MGSEYVVPCLRRESLNVNTTFALRHLGEVFENVVVGVSDGWHTALFGKSASLCDSVAYGHCWVLPETAFPGLGADSVCVTTMWSSYSKFDVRWLTIVWLRRYTGCGEVQS